MDAYRAKLESFDPDIAHAIVGEERRQLDGVEMIPSENYTYPEVLAALGSVLTNKYSEGYPGRRYYGGQQYTDAVENIARDRACALFRAEHANVQPLSGSPMNQACYFAFLNPGDTVLAMDLSHGGHLTHGAPVSHMGKVFNFVRYKSAPQQVGTIDFDELMDIAKATRPKIVLCGYSSYPRDYDYAAFKKVADEVGALTMADISHIGGLVAANVMRNPFDSGFDVVTTTTHKTLRGPRGGLILGKAAYAKKIDGILATLGIKGYKALRRDRREQLNCARQPDGDPIPPKAKARIERLLDRLDLVLKLIEEVESARDAVLKKDAPADEAERMIRSLTDLRSIGPDFATLLVREAFVRQFRNRRALGGYVGLGGTPFSSGGSEREQGIGKDGNARVRAAMVELAWMWLRWQPDSALSVWFRARVGAAGGRIRKIMIVALARKLLVALWRYVKDGVIPDGAKMKAA